jgi:hypothetical protein
MGRPNVTFRRIVSIVLPGRRRVFLDFCPSDKSLGYCPTTLRVGIAQSCVQQQGCCPGPSSRASSGQTGAAGRKWRAQMNAARRSLSAECAANEQISEYANQPRTGDRSDPRRPTEPVPVRNRLMWRCTQMPCSPVTFDVTADTKSLSSAQGIGPSAAPIPDPVPVVFDHLEVGTVFRRLDFGQRKYAALIAKVCCA